MECFKEDEQKGATTQETGLRKGENRQESGPAKSIKETEHTHLREYIPQTEHINLRVYALWTGEMTERVHIADSARKMQQ